MKLEKGINQKTREEFRMKEKAYFEKISAGKLLAFFIFAMMIIGLCVHDAANAAQPGEYFKASGVWVIDKQDIEVNTGALAGKVDLETKSDGYGGFFAIGKCANITCLEIEGGFERINSDPNSMVDVNMNLYSVMGRFCVEPGQGKVRPYACGGAGVLLLQSSAELMGEGGPIIVNGSAELLPGYDFSAGVWYQMKPSVTVGLGARYRNTFEDYVVDTSSFGGLSANVDIGHWIIEGSLRF